MLEIKEYVSHHKILTGLLGFCMLTSFGAPATQAVKLATFNPSSSNSASLFERIESPGNRAIAVAEGNFTLSGKKTKLYAGHIDPSLIGGRKVMNRGFCSSYGKGGNVAEADKYCLNRIKSRLGLLNLKFNNAGVNPEQHKFAYWNAVDLWNQAGAPEDVRFPAIYKKYIDNGVEPNVAILKARVESFQYKAGGLYNICVREPYFRKKLAGLRPMSNTWKYKCAETDQARRLNAGLKYLLKHKAI